MVDFNNWCDSQNIAVGSHSLTVLSARPEHVAIGCDTVAAVVPTHYASAEHLARALSRLGKPAAADFVRAKLPTMKSIKSGDLGEILATEYIANHTNYSVPIMRLRWKDHRNMAMHGEDVIGIEQNATTGRLRFLKAESKSRGSLAASVLTEARQGLDTYDGLPSAHALTFISQRLLETGNTTLADAIDDAQFKYGIATQSVTHLLFVFCGNEPTALLTANLTNYTGSLSQLSVGLRVQEHGTFIANVFDHVICNADNC